MDSNFVLEFASFLLKSNALRFGVFKLSSGKDSQYYIDLRVLPSFPKHFRLAIGGLRDTVLQKIGQDFDSLASIPTSGVVFGSALAYEMVRPFFYVRKEAKDYGTSKQIEGYLKPGSRVLVVDDVATTGMSVSKVVETIRANGGVVTDVIALVSRKEGAEENMKKMGVKLTTVTTVDEIVSTLHKAGLVDDNTLESVLRQMANRGENETD